MTSSREVARSLTATAAGDGQRLDLIVAAAAELSRTQAATLIATGMVLVNGAAEKAGHRPLANDLISITIPAPRGTHIVGEDLPLTIVFEDEHLLVVNKAAGMVVHPAPGNWSGTLVHALVGRKRRDCLSSPRRIVRTDCSQRRSPRDASIGATPRCRGAICVKTG
jgi:23S rRNA pseudouridine1911/1915/1917 synthase